MRLVVLSSALSMSMMLAGCGDDEGAGPGTDGDAGERDAAPSSCSADRDCDDGRFCNGPERCEPSASAADERGCAPGTLPCGGACDERMDACLGECDADGDGREAMSCGGDDCDDADADRFPGNAEVCDDADVDEDCDATTFGERDVDADDAFDARCCNVGGDGTRRCGTDCDDGAATVSPIAPEVCNGVDDDCNALVDDITSGVVICSAGQTAACVTAAGVAGELRCRGDCLGYEMCRADEVCNGVDDDLDGAVDDGFECARLSTSPCTTGCNTAGSVSCSETCTRTSTCVAPTETCNFCDDDGNEGILDERALATVTRSVVPLTCDGEGAPPYLAAGSARCDALPIDATRGEYYAVLLEGATSDESGAFWFDLPSFRVGWGSVRVEAVLRVERLASTIEAGQPATVRGGWSVVLAESGSGVGPGRQLGVPYTTPRGAAFQWWWSDRSDITSSWVDGDGGRYRRIGGGGSQIRGPVSGSESIAFSRTGFHLDASSSGVIQQVIAIEYQPDDPTTAATNEESVRFHVGGARNPTSEAYAYNPPVDPESALLRNPSNDLPVGTPIRVGFTAGTFDGTRVRARVYLRAVTFGSFGTVTYEDVSTASRGLVCPGT